MEADGFSDAPESFEADTSPELVEPADLDFDVINEPDQYVDPPAEGLVTDQSEVTVGPEQAEILHDPERLAEEEPGLAARPSWDAPPDQTSAVTDVNPDDAEANEVQEPISDNAQVIADTESDFELDTAFQIQAAADSIQQMDSINPENWQSLDAPQRLEALQDIENRMAEIQGRTPMGVVTDDMSDNTFGGYDGQKIALNASHLESEMPVDEFINTIVHEGRHAYQDYAIHIGDPAAESDRAAWSENWDNYLNAEDYGQELYQTQAIEEDAARYANQITGALIASNPGE